jgi:hypothetical protein
MVYADVGEVSEVSEVSEVLRAGFKVASFKVANLCNFDAEDG